jgi:hypothetical protein
MGAEGDQRHPVGQVVAGQVGGRTRAEDLSPVPDGPQPGGADHGPAHVVAGVAQLRLPGVQGHADRQVRPVRPGLGGQRQLDVHRRPDGLGGQREDGHHAVALALLHRPDTAPGANGRVEDLVVAHDGRRHGAPVRLPAGRRALDIREQEGDRADRQRAVRRIRHRVSLVEPVGGDSVRTPCTAEHAGNRRRQHLPIGI